MYYMEGNRGKEPLKEMSKANGVINNKSQQK